MQPHVVAANRKLSESRVKIKRRPLAHQGFPGLVAAERDADTA